MIIMRSPESLIGLRELISFLPGGKMVEIGCYSGESTVEFARKFDLVYAVDCWDDQICRMSEAINVVEKRFDERVKTFSNIVKMKKTGDVAVLVFEDHSLDFVYIDARHEYCYVRNDISKWVKKVKKGAHIGGHDFHVDHFGVIKAVKELFGNPLKVFSDASWLVEV